MTAHSRCTAARRPARPRWTTAGSSRTDDGSGSRVRRLARNLYARARSDEGTLIFGGQALDGGYLADLWLIADDDDAVPLEPAGPAPAGRAGAELVADPVRGRALLFGGRTADGRRRSLAARRAVTSRLDRDVQMGTHDDRELP